MVILYNDNMDVPKKLCLCRGHILFPYFPEIILEIPFHTIITVSCVDLLTLSK